MLTILDSVKKNPTIYRNTNVLKAAKVQLRLLFVWILALLTPSENSVKIW